jgi:hypothetical protein
LVDQTKKKIITIVIFLEDFDLETFFEILNPKKNFKSALIEINDSIIE